MTKPKMVSIALIIVVSGWALLIALHPHSHPESVALARTVKVQGSPTENLAATTPEVPAQPSKHSAQSPVISTQVSHPQKLTVDQIVGSSSADQPSEESDKLSAAAMFMSKEAALKKAVAELLAALERAKNLPEMADYKSAVASAQQTEQQYDRARLAGADAATLRELAKGYLQAGQEADQKATTLFDMEQAGLLDAVSSFCDAGMAMFLDAVGHGQHQKDYEQIVAPVSEFMDGYSWLSEFDEGVLWIDESRIKEQHGIGLDQPLPDSLKQAELLRNAVVNLERRVADGDLETGIY